MREALDVLAEALANRALAETADLPEAVAVLFQAAAAAIVSRTDLSVALALFRAAASEMSDEMEDLLGAGKSRQ